MPTTAVASNSYHIISYIYTSVGKDIRSYFVLTYLAVHGMLRCAVRDGRTDGRTLLGDTTAAVTHSSSG